MRYHITPKLTLDTLKAALKQHWANNTTPAEKSRSAKNNPFWQIWPAIQGVQKRKPKRPQEPPNSDQEPQEMATWRQESQKEGPQNWQQVVNVCFSLSPAQKKLHLPKTLRFGRYGLQPKRCKKGSPRDPKSHPTATRSHKRWQHGAKRVHRIDNKW